MSQTIKFYTDEHVAKAVIYGLRLRGVDVITTVEAGMRSASDKEHLERARNEGWVIFTQDDDFLRLHASGIPHAGIVYTPQRIYIGDIIYGLALIYQILDEEDMKGHVEYL
jgi:uncharacterized protein with PIN domain